MSLHLPELPGEQIGSLAEREALTFAGYVPGFLVRYAGRTCRGVRPETRETYARELGFQRDHNEDWVPLDPARGALAFLGALRLGQIDAARLERYAAGIAARGVSPNTVRMALAPVRALLATAVEEGLLASNPAAGLRLATPPSGAPRPARPKLLTPEQVRELTIAAQPPWRLLIQVLVETGLRFSEAAALTWEEIELERHRLHVRQRLSHGTLGPLNTESSYRTLEICDELERALSKLRSSRGYDNALSAPVFQNRNGRPLDRHHAHQQTKQAAISIGLPWVNLHTLRHTSVEAPRFRGHVAVPRVGWSRVS